MTKAAPMGWNNIMWLSDGQHQVQLLIKKKQYHAECKSLSAIKIRICGLTAHNDCHDPSNSDTNHSCVLRSCGEMFF